MTRVGIVLVRQVGAPRTEAFVNQVIAGLEDSLARESSTLIVRGVEDTAEELEVYRHWHRTQAVDAVVIKDIATDDHRIERLQEFRLPFVVLGDTTQTGPFPAVRFDNALAMRAAWEFLLGQGHHKIARVSGPPGLVHIRTRSEEFTALATSSRTASAVVAGDFSTDSGLTATVTLLKRPDPPTAIIYDNDLMALGGLAAAERLQVAVPDDLALLAWDDSVDCQLAQPALSALSHDVQRIGEQLGETLLASLTTGNLVSDVADQPVIVERGTTAPH